jgi:hypothetical protein
MSVPLKLDPFDDAGQSRVRSVSVRLRVRSVTAHATLVFRYHLVHDTVVYDSTQETLLRSGVRLRGTKRRSNSTNKRRLLVGGVRLPCDVYLWPFLWFWVLCGVCVCRSCSTVLEYVHSSYVCAPCSVHMRVCLGRILACASTPLWFHTILSS